MSLETLRPNQRLNPAFREPKNTLPSSIDSATTSNHTIPTQELVTPTQIYLKDLERSEQISKDHNLAWQLQTEEYNQATISKFKVKVVDSRWKHSKHDQDLIIKTVRSEEKKHKPTKDTQADEQVAYKLNRPKPSETPPTKPEKNWKSQTDDRTLVQQMSDTELEAEEINQARRLQEAHDARNNKPIIHDPDLQEAYALQLSYDVQKNWTDREAEPETNKLKKSSQQIQDDETLAQQIFDTGLNAEEIKKAKDLQETYDLLNNQIKSDEQQPNYKPQEAKKGQEHNIYTINTETQEDEVPSIEELQRNLNKLLGIEKTEDQPYTKPNPIPVLPTKPGVHVLHDQEDEDVKKYFKEIGLEYRPPTITINSSGEKILVV